MQVEGKSTEEPTHCLQQHAGTNEDNIFLFVTMWYDKDANEGQLQKIDLN